MPSSAPITASASGDNVIVAAVLGYSVRVVGYVLSFSGAVNAQWLSDVGGGAVALSGLLYGPAAGAVLVAVEPGPNARGWFQTARGKALNLNLSAAVAVGGSLIYDLVGG
jgi:hypothetical protein